MAHMVTDNALLHHPYFQLALSIPVYTIGLFFFGKSAYQSLKSGVPNMDVLIFIGAASALFYSLYGTFAFAGTHEVHQYLFFETGASIITFVLAGNVLEKRAVKRTTKALQTLNDLQPKTALVLQTNGTTLETVIEKVMVGNRVLVQTGKLIPLDGVILEGSAEVNEQMLSGESIPVYKQLGDAVTGGTFVESGNLTIQVKAHVKNSVLSQIIEMVKRAQANKPQIQQLGDKVSAVFVPVVVAISLLTFLVSYFWLDLSSAQSMLRAVAVLVISCPCAMGLATPTAIMVGIGKAAKRGILIKGGNVLEHFAHTNLIVFDKTGTLTTGKFSFGELKVYQGNAQQAMGLMYALEQKSAHPIAASFIRHHQFWFDPNLILENIKEEKGCGMQANYLGQEIRFGKASWAVFKVDPNLDLNYDLILSIDGHAIAALNIEDELKEGAVEMTNYFNQEQVPLMIVSGDKESKVATLAQKIGIKEWKSEQLPAQKLEWIEKFSKEHHTSMVGDGVNDAPALSKVNVGVSFSKGSDIAVEAASLVITRPDLLAIKEAHQISKMTYSTIKQNLFWAFFYNVLCIPLAAAGYMHPMLGALSMAFSDVIVIGNSLRLGWRKLK
jgi:P-type Cu+ transporter